MQAQSNTAFRNFEGGLFLIKSLYSLFYSFLLTDDQPLRANIKKDESCLDHSQPWICNNWLEILCLPALPGRRHFFPVSFFLPPWSRSRKAR